jgi:hypothetical protein
MAANLDRAETSLTAVSDIAYIRGIDGSGNSVRISKADLANVLGVIVRGEDIHDGSLNDIGTPGSYGIRLGDSGNTITDYPSELNGINSMMLVFPAPLRQTNAYIVQLNHNNTPANEVNRGSW